MASLPSISQVSSLISSSALQQAVGAMVPLGQISSVVQTLQNIQGFNPGAFSSLTNTMQGALQGFSQVSSIVSNFAGNSPVGAFLNTLQATGMAGATIASAAATAGNAFKAADSFLNTVSTISNFERLSSTRPTVEATRADNQGAGGGLRFPRDVGKYWIALSFFKADIGSIRGNTTTFGDGIILPVPDNYIDTNHLEYSAISLTNNVMGAAEKALGQIASKIGAGEIAKIGGGVTMAAAETAGALTGVAINTQQILKFSQPTLKKHTFQWKLIPSNAQESQDLYNIINTIKKNIYPATGGLVFDYPSLVKVYMSNEGQLYSFKPAYVDSFNVRYNPDGQAFYRDQYPMSVLIEMSICENEVWTSGDFGGATSSTNIGTAADVIGGAITSTAKGVYDTVTSIFQ